MTTIFTIGHGNRAIGEFVALLREAGMECVVDVRAYPVSRRHPHFTRDSFDKSLADAGVRYVWEGKALGGRRKLEKNSPHVALKNPGFRAFAGYMATEDFQRALDTLVETGRGQRTAMMCAERLPWQCHRHLVADSLVARGVRVLHLVSPGESLEHTLSRLARKDGKRLVYDAGEQLGLKL
jgi:uncharacterized protein (DUF488 family)